MCREGKQSLSGLRAVPGSTRQGVTGCRLPAHGLEPSSQHGMGCTQGARKTMALEITLLQSHLVLVRGEADAHNVARACWHPTVRIVGAHQLEMR